MVPVIRFQVTYPAEYSFHGEHLGLVALEVSTQAYEIRFGYRHSSLGNL